MPLAANASAGTPPRSDAVQARLAAIFANQRRWLLRMAVPGTATSVGGMTVVGGEHDASLVLPLGQPVAAAALDAALAFLRRRASVGGVLVWSATGDEPRRTQLTRRLLARGADEAFRPRWMTLDLTPARVQRAQHPDPAGIYVWLATAGDEAAVAAAQEAGTPYTSAPEAATFIAHGRRPASRQRAWLLLARDAGGDGRVLGQVAVNLTRGTRGIAGIYSMGVHPTAQRRGIGRALIRAAAALARARGASALGLNATPDGERLYTALGFTAVGDGQTWHLPANRLAAAPAPDAVRFAEAVAAGNISTLERLAPLFPANNLLPNGESPLAFASRFNQSESARWLLARGAPSEIVPLWSLGRRDEATALLAEPVLVNARSGPDRLTPLHEAVARDDRELATLLLAAGADLTATDERYNGTPLGWAKALGRTGLIPLLEGERGGAEEGRGR